MSEALERFCADSREALRANPGPAGRERVRLLIETLLADADFADAQRANAVATGDRETLYEDPELGFCVLLHVNENPRVSPPHDHGNSWAIYGQLSHHTDMTEYRRVDGGSGPGPAKLEKLREYRLEPGRAGLYDVGGIHQIDYPAGARFVRVTGTDLEVVPRLRYDMKRGEAIEIQGATVGSN